MSVRLEKILYERLFNTAMLGRQRVISVPRLWDYDNLEKIHKLEDQRPVFKKETGWMRYLEPVLSYFSYKWSRDIALQRGLSLEDFILFDDVELRRSPFHEHLMRQSLHPYMHVLFKRRRARYYKVERAVRGFFVPEYLRKEAASRLLKDTAENIDDWENFYETNFANDMTPNLHWPTTARLIPLEIFIFYGFFNEAYWTQYFYNETIPEPTQAEVEQYAREYLDQRKYFDVETEEGRREFEAEVNRFIELHPGSIVKEGEQYNFKRFYAQYALLNNRDTSKFEKTLIDDIKQRLEAKQAEKLRQITDKVTGEHKAPAVGTKYPARLQSHHKKVLL